MNEVPDIEVVEHDGTICPVKRCGRVATRKLVTQGKAWRMCRIHADRYMAEAVRLRDREVRS